jgi:hypothetical protein
MHYRSLLVLLDNSPGCAARTQLAIRLARDRDCHLVGLAPTGLIDVPSGSHGATSLTNYAALMPRWRGMCCATRPRARHSDFATSAMPQASGRMRP